LRSLKLEAIATTVVQDSFYNAFPSLQELILLNNINTTMFLLPLAGTVYLPQLHTLILTNAEYAFLRTFIETRATFGSPITTLQVDSPRWLDISALHWLKRNVEKFIRVPRPKKRNVQVPADV
jgi:hypothetical protein